MSLEIQSLRGDIADTDRKIYSMEANIAQSQQKVDEKAAAVDELKVREPYLFSNQASRASKTPVGCTRCALRRVGKSKVQII